MRQEVESAPDGIGFLSNYQADKGGLNSRRVNGVACNQTTAASGQYAGVAVFYEVTKGPATGAAPAFINWVDSSGAAKKIIASQWVAIALAATCWQVSAMLERLRKPWPDHRAERTLGAVSLLVGVGRRGDGRVRRRCAPGRCSSTTGSAGCSAAATSKRDQQDDRRDDQPGRGRLPPARVAADLRHAADDRDRGRARPRDRGALVDLHRRARARARAAGS